MSDVYALAIMADGESSGFVEGFDVGENSVLALDIALDYTDALMYKKLQDIDRLGVLLKKATGQEFAIVRIPEEESECCIR